MIRSEYFRWMAIKFGSDSVEESLRVKNQEDPMGMWEREAIIDARLAGHFGRLALGQTLLAENLPLYDEHFPITDVGCDIPGGGAM